MKLTAILGSLVVLASLSSPALAQETLVRCLSVESVTVEGRSQRVPAHELLVWPASRQALLLQGTGEAHAFSAVETGNVFGSVGNGLLFSAEGNSPGLGFRVEVFQQMWIGGARGTLTLKGEESGETSRGVPVLCAPVRVR